MFYSPLKQADSSTDSRPGNDYASGEYGQAKKGRDRTNSDEAVEIVQQPSVRSKVNPQRRKEVAQMALDHLKMPERERDEILDDSRLFDRSRHATIEQSGEECEAMDASLDDAFFEPNQVQVTKKDFQSPKKRQLLGQEEVLDLDIGEGLFVIREPDEGSAGKLQQLHAALAASPGFRKAKLDQRSSSPVFPGASVGRSSASNSLPKGHPNTDVKDFSHQQNPDRFPHPKVKGSNSKITITNQELLTPTPAPSQLNSNLTYSATTAQAPSQSRYHSASLPQFGLQSAQRAVSISTSNQPAQSKPTRQFLESALPPSLNSTPNLNHAPSASNPKRD